MKSKVAMMAICMCISAGIAANDNALGAEEASSGESGLGSIADGIGDAAGTVTDTIDSIRDTITGTINKIKKDNPAAREVTQLLVLASQVKQEFDTAAQLAIDTKNQLMGVLNGDFLKPDDVIEVYDIFNRMNNAKEDVIARFEELMNFYPDRAELFEHLGLSYSELSSFREYMEEQYATWSDKVDTTLKDMTGISVAYYDKMQKEHLEKEMATYINSIQADCAENKGTNCMLEVLAEQNRYMTDLQQAFVTITASSNKAFGNYYSKMEKVDVLAAEKWNRATNVEGWDEEIRLKTRSVNPHWRD